MDHFHFDDFDYINNFYKMNTVNLKEEKKSITYENSYYINKAKKESNEIVLTFEENDITKFKPYEQIKNMSKEEKKERRKAKNNISARNTVKRKKKYTEMLETYVLQLENKINDLSGFI